MGLSFNKCLVAKIVFGKSRSLYTFVRDDAGKGIEVLIIANSDFTIKIRYIEKNAAIEMRNIAGLLLNEIEYTDEI